MTSRAIKYPVELRRDAKGIYGIGAVKGVVVDVNDMLPPDLILRPDRLSERKRDYPAALQMIGGGFRRGMFSMMSEELFRRIIHHEMLRRKGLAWPPLAERWWSRDPEQRA